MEKTKIAIVGLGTVGTGVARLLLEHAERIQRHAGREIVLEKVVWILEIERCNQRLEIRCKLFFWMMMTMTMILSL